MSNILIFAVGSRGDAQPMIALGKGLKAAGHRVRLLASNSFAGWIESHGLEAVPCQVDMQELMLSDTGRAWVAQGNNPLSMVRLMKELLSDFGPPMVEDAIAAVDGADLLISGFASDVWATALAEKYDIPQVSAPLQPVPFAVKDGRALMNAPLPYRKSWINWAFAKLIIERFPWQLYGDLTNRIRQRLGLPKQAGQENLAARQRLLTLHALSPRAVPRPPEWPDHFHLTGFWFLDEDEAWTPPGDLLAFLEAGPPPVYIGFGSMTSEDPATTTDLVLSAVAQSGQRAVLLSGWAGLGTRDLPPTVFRLESAPHGWLFPRMAAVVHHGGAGTTAAGLRAGVPSILIPHFSDQPYWGTRIKDLGVGPDPIPRSKLSAKKLAHAITQAVTDGTIRAQARQFAAAIAQEDGVGRAIGLIGEEIPREQVDSRATGKR